MTGNQTWLQTSNYWTRGPRHRQHHELPMITTLAVYIYTYVCACLCACVCEEKINDVETIPHMTPCSLFGFKFNALPRLQENPVSIERAECCFWRYEQVFLPSLLAFQEIKTGQQSDYSLARLLCLQQFGASGLTSNCLWMLPLSDSLPSSPQRSIVREGRNAQCPRNFGQIELNAPYSLLWRKPYFTLKEVGGPVRRGFLWTVQP